MTRPAVATIAAKSWLAPARVLARLLPAAASGAALLRAARRRGRGALRPGGGAVSRWCRLADLALPRPERFRFRHAQQELSYAATPFLLAHLLDRGFDRVLFLKQESLVVGDLGAALRPPRRALDPADAAPAGAARRRGRGRSASSTSCCRASTTSGCSASPRRPRRAASSPGGGSAPRPTAARRSPRGCTSSSAGSTWCPAGFDEVEIVRDPGANVGHWNLPERRVEVDGDEVKRGRLPAAGVVRFSGYDPERPHRDHPPLAAADAADARSRRARCFERYRRGARRAPAMRETPAWPYAFGRFDDGVAIPDRGARVLRELGDAAARFGDPFARGARRSFRRLPRGAGRRGRRRRVRR